MRNTVGVGEFRQNLSRYLRRVERGERLLLLAAGALAEPALRTLDAIHVAAVVEVSPTDAFVSYDERQAAAARLAGLRTVNPGS